MPKLSEILGDFVENSALHGLPRIRTSRQIAVRVLWACLFLATAGVFGFQLVSLFREYYSYPIKTSVNLKHHPISYPAITFCNMNPVKRSVLAEVDELKNAISVKTSKTAARKKRSVESSAESTLESLSGNISESSSGSTSESSVGSTSEFSSGSTTESSSGSTTESSSGTSTESSSRSTSKSSSGSTSESSSGSTSESSSGSGSGSSSGSKSESSSGSGSADDEYWDYWGSGSGEVYTSNLTSFNWSSASGVTNKKYISSLSSVNSSTGGNTNSSDDTGTYLEYMVDQFYSAKDEWFERTLRFQTAIRNESQQGKLWPNIQKQTVQNLIRQLLQELPDLGLRCLQKVSICIYMSTTRETIGHNKYDMVLSATYSGSLQDISTFHSVQTTDYGNCYTMESSKYRAWKSGPATGIKLTFNLEIDEYLQNYASGYGIRMVFHNPGTYPLPADEGITLSPGYESSIGLRMVRVSRLGQPYGECSDGIEFKKKYNMQYTITSCRQFCRVENVIATCDCIPPDGPDSPFITSTARVCDTTVNDRLCILSVDAGFDDGSLDCDCISPCSDTMYEKTISGRVWPNDDYLSNVLMGEVCTKNISSMKYACSVHSNETESFDYDRYRYNFLQVQIYFEDLNYENIIEEPLYEIPRFLSDIGGAMGLFLGGSLLSFAEILQVILEIILYLFKRTNNPSQGEKKDNKVGDSAGSRNATVESNKNTNSISKKYSGFERKTSPLTVFEHA